MSAPGTQGLRRWHELPCRAVPCQATTLPPKTCTWHPSLCSPKPAPTVLHLLPMPCTPHSTPQSLHLCTAELHSPPFTLCCAPQSLLPAPQNLHTVPCILPPKPCTPPAWTPSRMHLLLSRTHSPCAPHTLNPHAEKPPVHAGNPIPAPHCLCPTQLVLGELHTLESRLGHGHLPPGGVSQLPQCTLTSPLAGTPCQCPRVLVCLALPPSPSVLCGLWGVTGGNP